MWRVLNPFTSREPIRFIFQGPKARSWMPRRFAEAVERKNMRFVPIKTDDQAHRPASKQIFWWAHQDLNLEPKRYEHSALTN